MELNQLRYFQTVARYQQMTKAAEELHISQSSLSKTISMLEADIGAKLFDRLGNRIILNSVGKAFLERVDRLLLELEDAVQEANSADHGRVHFAANIPGLCTDYIEQFIRQNPKVMLTQSLMSSEQMVSALETGELDCALTFTDLSSERLVCSPLAQEEMLMLVSFKHPLAGYSKTPLAAFSGDPFICNNAGFDTRRLLIDQCRMAGFYPNIVFDGNESELAFKLVADNYGVMMVSSIVYSWLMGMDIVNPPLNYISALHISEPGLRRPLWLAMLKGHYVSKTTENFISGLKTYFEKLTDRK